MVAQPGPVPYEGVLADHDAAEQRGPHLHVRPVIDVRAVAHTTLDITTTRIPMRTLAPSLHGRRVRTGPDLRVLAHHGSFSMVAKSPTEALRQRMARSPILTCVPMVTPEPTIACAPREAVGSMVAVGWDNGCVVDGAHVANLPS